MSDSDSDSSSDEDYIPEGESCVQTHILCDLIHTRILDLLEKKKGSGSRD